MNKYWDWSCCLLPAWMFISWFTIFTLSTQTVITWTSFVGRSSHFSQAHLFASQVNVSLFITLPDGKLCFSNTIWKLCRVTLGHAVSFSYVTLSILTQSSWILPFRVFEACWLLLIQDGDTEMCPLFSAMWSRLCVFEAAWTRGSREMVKQPVSKASQS